MSKILIWAGILFVLIIIGILLNELCHFIRLSDFTRGLSLGVLLANTLCWLEKRYLP